MENKIITKNEDVNKNQKLIKNNNTIVFNGTERKIVKRDDKSNRILIEIPITNSKGSVQMVQQWIKDINE